MTAGFTPSSSSASSTTICASPRADPPPEREGDAGRASRRGGAVAHAGRLRRARRLSPAQTQPARRGRIGASGDASGRDEGLDRLARQHALQLALQLLLGGLGRGQHLLEAVELQHVEFVDIDIDVDVGLRGAELLAHDRALQDLRGRYQRGKGRGLQALAGAAGGAGHIDGDGDVGGAFQHVERQRVDEAAVHQQAVVALHAAEERRQRDAGGDGAAQVARCPSPPAPGRRSRSRRP